MCSCIGWASGLTLSSRNLGSVAYAADRRCERKPGRKEKGAYKFFFRIAVFAGLRIYKLSRVSYKSLLGVEALRVARGHNVGVDR